MIGLAASPGTDVPADDLDRLHLAGPVPGTSGRPPARWPMAGAQTATRSRPAAATAVSVVSAFLAWVCWGGSGQAWVCRATAAQIVYSSRRGVAGYRAPRARRG